MVTFLKYVGAFLVALIILLVLAVFYIKKKLKSFVSGLADAIKAMAAGAGVPPFRVNVKPITAEEFTEDADDKKLGPINAASTELKSLGFEKIGEFLVEEVFTSMRAFVDRETGTYAAIYNCPSIDFVWCDVVRRYADGSGWTYANKEDDYIRFGPKQTTRFFPGESLTGVVEQFREAAPTENVVCVDDEEFPKFFEQSYARSMDYLISHGGPTEAEIRQIAEKSGEECTDEQVAAVQKRWRTAISEFLSERVLRRYRKDAGLSPHQWEELEYQAAVIHERMQAEQILHIFDNEYDDDPIQLHFGGEDDEEEEDPEELARKEQWSRQLEQLRGSLCEGPPQQAFRMLLHAEGKLDQWKFVAPVSKPLSADIWMRPEEVYDDERDNDEFADDFDDDEVCLEEDE